MINNNVEGKGNWLQHLITKLIILNPPSFGSKSDYESLAKFKNKIIFIERDENNHSENNYIPCLFYRNPNSSNYLIYFHGNSEHIFQIEYYGLDFRSYLEMNVIIVEYPGYSIYPCEDPDSNIFFKNTLIVYDWVKKKFKANDNQIFVCGRSIGTGSAIYLASKRNPNALFLISAFSSLKNVAKDLWVWVSYFVEEIFNSYRYINNISCPILFIHGKKDSLINYRHSEQLSEELKRNNDIVELKLHENMTHNDFDLKEDIIYPILDFINKHNLRSNENIIDLSEDELEELYKIPLSITKKVESILFDINNFKFNKIIDERKAIFSTKSGNNIIFISGQKILMYNQKNYGLDEEIDININGINEVISTLFQMKNKNIVCGTNLGNIIIYEKDSETEEYKKIKHIQIPEEIYKIENLMPNLICILTKNSLLFYDEFLNEEKPINIIKLQSLYFNFSQILNDSLAMLSHDYLDICQIKGNELKNISVYKNLKLYNYKNNFIKTNKFIIIGGSRCIYYLNYTKDFGIEDMNERVINEEINYIYKIHDEFLLASTREGAIIQININNNILDIKQKYFINNQINSLYMKNFKTIFITDKNSIQIWNNNDESYCNIF